MAGRAGSGGDGRAKGINVDCDIEGRAFGDARDNAVWAQSAGLAHRQDVRAHAARIFIAFTRSGRHIANTDLG